MKTRNYDPHVYGCWGTDSVMGRTHVKGCKVGCALRWSPSRDRVYSVECANQLRGVDLVRCVPTDGKDLPVRALPWDPAIYTCYGGANGHGVHAKGCKGKRPLRWDPDTMHLHSVECMRTFTPERHEGFWRCVPTAGKFIPQKSELGL